MALPEVKEIDLKYLDGWMSNLVDTINYDLAKIEGEVPTLNQVLTNADTAPIQYLRDSLNDLVNNINAGFEQIDDRLRTLESRNNTQGG